MVSKRQMIPSNNQVKFSKFLYFLQIFAEYFAFSNFSIPTYETIDTRSKISTMLDENLRTLAVP